MLTKDEAELYDRQIRLWGVNAQSRIRQSKVLMLGFNGVASEVAKILVLAGIDTLTIVDDQPLQASDITSNLFCRPSANEHTPNQRTHAVKAKLRTLNPLVKVNITNSSILSLRPEDYNEFDLVTLHSFLGIEDINNINEICRTNGAKFYLVLDFGFFGFMFNDLGPEFKFSYEGFNQAEVDAKSRQTGEKKDPISLVDDVATEDDPDAELGSSDGEGEERPKKKMRVHSPKSEPVADNSKETLTKVGSLSYVEFQTMISLEGAIFTKKTSPVLLVSIAMLKFYGQNKHLPRCQDPKEKDEDCSKLKEILESLKKSLNVHDRILDRLDDRWFDHIYDSLSPVCAILGGVAGQDMIRALSNKDIPISNTFSFDGMSMNGIVEKIGSDESRSLKPQPIVRDVMCIDSD